MAEVGNIAVFLAGWNSEYQTRLIEGIQKKANEAGYSISIFTCQAGWEISDTHVYGENMIYSLANLKRFDGIICATHTIWMKEAKTALLQRIKESGIPAVSLEESAEGMNFIGIDNYTSMKNMLNHLYEEHGYRRMVFVAGPSNNAESRRRGLAFGDFVHEKNLDLVQCPVWYGDFSFDSGRRIVNRMYEKDRQMPEVFVCANDKMAVGVCNGLKEHGYRVPEDVAVTGFDASYDSERYIPTITSVDRPKEQLGYQACEMLLHTIETGELEMRKVEAGIQIHRSCGCADDALDRSEEIIGQLYAENQNRERYSRAIRNMDDEMSECETLQELVFCIRQNLEKMTTEDVYLCLNQSVYFEMTGHGASGYRNRSIVKKYGSKVYTTIISRQEGMPSFEPFDTAQMFPAIWEQENPSEFLFVPVHFRDNCLGYLVIKGPFSKENITYYYNWVRKISNALEKLSNILMLKNAVCNIDNLAVMDSLTGVYNRLGITRYVTELVDWANTGQHGLMFVFADLDRLKHINDQYGHEAGDQAICLVANALQEVFGKNEMLLRYGGDEFLLVSRLLEPAQMEEKQQKVSKKLAEWKEKDKLEYPLSVSIGYYYKEGQVSGTLEDYIERADESMYRYKCQNRK